METWLKAQAKLYHSSIYHNLHHQEHSRAFVTSYLYFQAIQDPWTLSIHTLIILKSIWSYQSIKELEVVHRELLHWYKGESELNL